MTLEQICNALAKLYRALALIYAYRASPTLANEQTVWAFANKHVGYKGKATDIDALERLINELISELHRQKQEIEATLAKAPTAAEVCLPPTTRQATAGLRQQGDAAPRKPSGRDDR